MTQNRRKIERFHRDFIYPRHFKVVKMSCTSVGDACYTYIVGIPYSLAKHLHECWKAS